MESPVEHWDGTSVGTGIMAGHPYPGPLLVGTLLSYFLAGVLLLQILAYISDITGSIWDCWHTHVLVVLITLSEILTVVFISSTAWLVLVVAAGREFGVPTPTLPVTDRAIPILNGFVTLVAQAFFTRKIALAWADPVGRAISVACGVLTLVQFSSSAATTVFAATQLSKEELDDRTGVSTAIHLGSAFACNTLLTFALLKICTESQASLAPSEPSTTTYGTDSRGTTPPHPFAIAFSRACYILERRTAEVIMPLLTVLSLIGLVVWAAPGTRHIAIAFQLATGRIYPNTVLAALNAYFRPRGSSRRRRRSHSFNINSSDIPLTNLHFTTVTEGDGFSTQGHGESDYASGAAQSGSGSVGEEDDEPGVIAERKLRDGVRSDGDSARVDQHGVGRRHLRYRSLSDGRELPETQSQLPRHRQAD